VFISLRRSRSRDASANASLQKQTYSGPQNANEVGSFTRDTDDDNEHNPQVHIINSGVILWLLRLQLVEKKSLLLESAA
jgi:hypothetical protein